MECVFGVVGNGFTIVAADTSSLHNILLHKKNEDKVMVLDSHKLIAASGEPGDRVQFTEYVQKNVSLYQFRNGIPLTTAAAANFTRGELAIALRNVSSHDFGCVPFTQTGETLHVSIFKLIITFLVKIIHIILITTLWQISLE